MSTLRILRSGIMTTVQDLGRRGHQRHGILEGGAMDAVALRMANLLVGNDDNAAGLEICLPGPKLVFLNDQLIALSGAHFSPTLQGQPIPLNRPIWVAAGMELALGAPVAGRYCYLAVAGGIAVPQVLGSRATYLRAALGGLHGRTLLADDELPLGEPSLVSQRLSQALKPGSSVSNWAAARWSPGLVLGTRHPSSLVLRALRGPEYPQFTSASQQDFWQQPFQLSSAADRMGSRLQGPVLARLPEAGELLSTAVCFGTVQVPAGGQPIVLLADHATTGGYPRIAQVISVDFPALAQAAPGQAIRFQEVSLEEAQALYLAQEQHLHALKRGIAIRSASSFSA